MMVAATGDGRWATDDNSDDDNEGQSEGEERGSTHDDRDRGMKE